MKLKLARLAEDDEGFGFKKGDLVLVDWDYDDDEKVCGLFRLPNKLLSNAFYKSQLDFIEEWDFENLDQE